MDTYQDECRIPAGSIVDLKHWPTAVKPVCDSPKAYRAMLETHVARLSDLQERLFASSQYAVLLIVQGMDAAGKDGSIKHVMSGVNPQGCQVSSFKHPSADELRHDFLWRTSRRLPPRGMIGIFNRSYYEEVLITRVHPKMLGGEGVPDMGPDKGTFWPDRYRSINDLEWHLDRNFTRIIKIYLHLSKEEQRVRLLSRIDVSYKNWKMNLEDMNERGFWNDYVRAYEDCLSATNSSNAPWYIVPADDKDNARIMVSGIVVGTLEALQLSYPKSSHARLDELKSIRHHLTT